jgi:hypothetical protein
VVGAWRWGGGGGGWIRGGGDRSGGWRQGHLSLSFTAVDLLPSSPPAVQSPDTSTPCRCFRPATYQGVPKVDECGLAEIGNSKEETRGTQFRQVRAACKFYTTSCMLRSSGLIGCDYKMMRMREKGPCRALYSPRGRVTGRFRERVLVVYVYESFIQYKACIASYPSTSPP